jgi:hypothetical protein
MSIGPANALTVTYGDFSDLSAFQQNGATAAIVDPVTDASNRKVSAPDERPESKRQRVPDQFRQPG